MKTQLIKIHRWFGVVMCIFFVTWFLSGFVMLYADFPQFGTKERLFYNSPLDLRACRFVPAGLNKLVTADTAWRSIRIDMLLNRPVFRLENTEGDLHSFYADNGSRLKNISRADAQMIAVQYFRHDRPQSHDQPVLTEKIHELDQWIPRSSFLIHMPVYRITMNDLSETMLYISSKTGEIIQVHNRRMRFLAWCGPVIHWIYPKELILRRPWWRFVVITASSLGIIASLSGIITGLIRVKKKNKGYSSPYQKKWFKWHHYTGFIFGLFTFTWVFSGLLTMSPMGWSPEVSLNEPDNLKLQGGQLTTRAFNRPVNAAFAKPDRRFSPVEIVLRRFQGRNFYIAYDQNGKTRIGKGECRIGSADQEDGSSSAAFSGKTMIQAINLLNGSLKPAEMKMLREEDNYYYSKHNDNKLPVLQLKYNDPEQTWYYADLTEGTVTLKNNRLSRINRWLYHGLHSLDFFNLQHRRPVWDILIIFLLTGGTAVSITGLVLGVKRIKRLF